MRIRLLVLSALVFALPNFAHAGPIDLNYAVNGTGGTSAAIDGFSSTSFSWVDYTGGVNGAAIAASYGFNPVPGLPGMLDTLVGSVMISTPFSLGDGETLTTSLSVLTNLAYWPVGVAGFGFAALLEGSVVEAILADIRPDGATSTVDIPHPHQFDLQSPSQGVTMTAVTRDRTALAGVNLGGSQYGDSVDLSSCGTRCVTDVTSSYTPGQGTYQLLFGTYQIGSRDYNAETALAVKSVNVEPVPEPGTVGLMAVGLFALVFGRRLIALTSEG